MMIGTTIVLMVLVAYAQMRAGMFTALCMFVNIMLAGLMAFCFFEPFANWLEPVFQSNFLAGYEDFLALIVIFVGVLIPLRALTNRLAPEMLDFAANVQYVGVGIALVNGYFVAGFLICALETMPWHENFLEFRPRVTNETGLRSVLPPDHVWLSMMRYAGAHCLAWEVESEVAENAYDRYRTFDRDATFEQRYLRYRRFSDGTPPSAIGSGGARGPLTYQKQLEKQLYRE